MSHTNHARPPSRREAAAIERRASGAAGPHADRRGRRTRTRSAALAAAVREQSS